MATSSNIIVSQFTFKKFSDSDLCALMINFAVHIIRVMIILQCALLPVAASPPEDLRVVIPVYGSHSDLLVTWKHEACWSPDEGYVIAFELVYCQLDEHKLCIGT